MRRRHGYCGWMGRLVWALAGTSSSTTSVILQNGEDFALDAITNSRERDYAYNSFGFLTGRCIVSAWNTACQRHEHANLRVCAWIDLPPPRTSFTTRFPTLRSAELFFGCKTDGRAGWEGPAIGRATESEGGVPLDGGKNVYSDPAGMSPGFGPPASKLSNDLN